MNHVLGPFAFSSFYFFLNIISAIPLRILTRTSLEYPLQKFPNSMDCRKHQLTKFHARGGRGDLDNGLMACLGKVEKNRILSLIYLCSLHELALLQTYFGSRSILLKESAALAQRNVGARKSLPISNEPFNFTSTI